MHSIVDYLFARSAFLPHGICLSWRPDLIGLHLVADALIVIAYFSIPVTLFVLVRRRKDFQYPLIVGLFATFIMACGITHLFGIVTLWEPVYALEGVIKLGTGLVSVATAIALVKLMPSILAIPSPSQLVEAIDLLNMEVKERERAEKLLSDAIASITDGFVLLDDQGSVITSNAAYSDMHRGIEDLIRPGASFDDLVRASMERGLLDVPPEERDAFVAACATSGDAVELHHADGRWLRRSSRPTSTGGTVIIWTDITEGKEREEALRINEKRYRRLYKRTPVMMHSIDTGGHLLAVSDFWLNRMEYEREDVIGRRSTEFMTPESARYLADTVIPLFFETGEIKDVEYQFVTRTGKIIDVLVSATSERDQDGKIERSLAVLTDVTEKKQTEAKLRQAQKMEAVGRLTGGIAHDFNNMLTIVMGNIRLVTRDESLPEDKRARLDAATSAARRGAELTKRLLLFARQQPLAPQIVDAAETLMDMQDLLSRAMGDSIDLNISAIPGKGLVRVDPAEFESAIINLAVNARDAMPGGGRLTVETEVVGGAAVKRVTDAAKAADHYLRISVTDTGSGIPQADLDQIFEPFFSTKPVGEGTGLGLSMVYGFVTQSEGQIAVYSEMGQGTTFHIFLPIQAGAVVTEPEDTNGDALHDFTGRERILLVEDSAAVRAVAATVLRDAGYEVVEAENGAAALNILEGEGGEAFDLLFTDVMMPGGMFGGELAKRVRALFPDIRVLFASGYPRQALRGSAGLEIDIDLLAKPYDDVALLRKVREVLTSEPRAL